MRSQLHLLSPTIPKKHPLVEMLDQTISLWAVRRGPKMGYPKKTVEVTYESGVHA